MQYGLIGEKLGHSYSREIHENIAGYKYELVELTREELPAFLQAKDFCAINVTIPYKQAVIHYLDYIDDSAKTIGAVNTIVNRDGKLHGYNTDFSGMRAQLAHMGVSLCGENVLILGAGGTAKTAHAVAESLQASSIVTLPRCPEGYNEAAKKHPDTTFIINATPVGMYPKCEDVPVDISVFPHLKGIFDAIYNPLRSNLILDGQARGLPAEGGLYMLSAQAVFASGLFRDVEISQETTDSAYEAVKRDKMNIVLVGMPSAGKSTVGKILSEMTGKEYVDTDDLIIQKAGMSIPEIFSTQGEGAFRDMESGVIASISDQSGLVIATGGGAILRAENVRRLKRNGVLVFLDRAPDELISTADRPLSKDSDAVMQLYKERYPLYQAAADVRVESLDTPEKTANSVLRSLPI
ncbi:MAG: shikimate kinase [Acutalibacteraceae bacterium]